MWSHTVKIYKGASEIIWKKLLFKIGSDPTPYYEITRRCIIHAKLHMKNLNNSIF